MPIETVIVILNYRTPEMTIQCLEALAKQITPKEKVIVVDNFSDDGSVEKIQKVIKYEWVSIIALESNRGYAAGNNAAIKEALKWQTPPKYVWVLNPDTIPLEGALGHLVDFMDSHPKAGIVGSQLQDADGTKQRSSFRFPSISTELEDGFKLGLLTQLLSQRKITREFSEQPQKTDWVSGASFLIRTEVLKQVGLLDEKYFLYFEEVDLSYRAHLVGWQCWSIPDSRVIHFVGQSTQLKYEDVQPKRRPNYWFESRRRYFQKNYGRPYSCLADSAWMLGFGTWRLRRLIQKKPDRDPPHMLYDFFRHSSLFNKSH